MCGIVAVIHADTSLVSAAADLHDALYLLQHLEQVRGGVKRPKVPEAAKNTVNGTTVHENLSPAVAWVGQETARSLVASASQDISLHNFND